METALSLQVWDLIDRVDQAKGIEDLFNVVKDLRGVFDVEHAVYHSVSGTGETYALATYGTEWSKHYEEDQLYHVDPVVRAAFTRFGSYNWAELDWSGDQLAQFKNESIEGGVGNQGLSLPVRGPNGNFALVSTSDRSADEVWAKKLERIEPHLVMLGHYLHETTMDLTDRKNNVSASLSPRERDVLLFLSQGHNRANVADRLNISEHTLRVYVDAARRKLNAQNTTHAVASALRHGLIAI
ncbi:MAG: LuxR family transcriptional regulator [Pseudomonadota bacterium]